MKYRCVLALSPEAEKVLSSECKKYGISKSNYISGLLVRSLRFDDSARQKFVKLHPEFSHLRPFT